MLSAVIFFLFLFYLSSFLLPFPCAFFNYFLSSFFPSCLLPFFSFFIVFYVFARISNTVPLLCLTHVTLRHFQANRALSQMPSLQSVFPAFPCFPFPVLPSSFPAPRHTLLTLLMGLQRACHFTARDHCHWGSQEMGLNAWDSLFLYII